MRTKIRSVVAGTALIAASVAAGQSPRQAPIFDLGGAIGWPELRSAKRQVARGKVALIDFRTYTCINSLRPLPYVKSWAAKYKDAGLVVIGVHTPEFSFEKERANVEHAARNLNVTYQLPSTPTTAFGRRSTTDPGRRNTSSMGKGESDFSTLGRRIRRDRACHPETPERKRSCWSRMTATVSDSGARRRGSAWSRCEIS